MEDIDYSELSIVELQALARELRSQLDDVYSELSRRSPTVYTGPSPDEIKKEQRKATVKVTGIPNISLNPIKDDIVEELAIWGPIKHYEVKDNKLYVTYEDYRDAEDVIRAFADGSTEIDYVANIE